MLGISAGLEQKTVWDFQKPTDYISYLFTGIRGWICRGQINPEYRQTMLRFNGLMERSFTGLNNVYISMNTFCINERTSDRLKRLNTLYVDIDCYKLGLDKAIVLEALREDYFESAIPCPTFVIDSGRGLYLIWKLRNEDRNALPRWTRVQEYLIQTLKEFGADPACKDCTRILRVPFTRNTKSGTDVEILEFNDLTYTISEIQKEYDIVGSYRKHADNKKSHPYNTATEPMRHYAADLALKLGVELPDLEDFSATQAWIAKMRLKVPRRTHREENALHFDPKENTKMCCILQGYCTDMETLFSMRQGADCKREIALFLYRLFCYDMTGDKDLALEKTLAFNASLSCPFPESYVKRATMSAERKIDKGDTYHYKRETIISILEITGEEMKSLTYLVGEVRRRERKQENNRKAYLERLAAVGKETKAAEKEKRRAAILAMQKEGMGAPEIIAALAISKATYYRETAAIAARNGLEAARNVVETAVEKVAETAKKALEAVLETVEQAASTEEEEKCPSEIEEDAEPMEESALNGEVSKNQPYYCKSTAEQCRTVMVVSTGVDGHAFGVSSSGSGCGVRPHGSRSMGSGSLWESSG
jgi:hypothetical protein